MVPLVDDLAPGMRGRVEMPMHLHDDRTYMSDPISSGSAGKGTSQCKRTPSSKTTPWAPARATNSRTSSAFAATGLGQRTCLVRWRHFFTRA